MQPAVEEEFERFYRQRERQVRRVVMGMLGDAPLAADAAQETWLRYLRYVDRPDPRFDVALLIAVARNVARDFWRRRKPEQLNERMADRAGAANVEDSILMADLVARLPLPEREVVVLHYALDLPLDAIARQLGQSESAIKSRLHRARLRLRDEFEQGEGTQHGTR